MKTHKRSTEPPEDRKEDFLEAYKQCGTVRGAQAATGISRHTHRDWLKGDEEYAKEFSESQAVFGEKVEDVMFTRIFDDPKCHHVLIIFALKGLMREKYGDRVIAFDEEAANNLDKIIALSDKPKVRNAGKIIVKELRSTADDPLGIGA